MRFRIVAWGLFAFGGVSARAFAQSPPAAPQTIALGDWELAPTLEVRARGEYRHDPAELGGVDATGEVTPRVRDAGGAFERARLGIGADRGWLHAQFTLQSAYAWGSPIPNAVLGATSNEAQFSAYEAFAEARTSSAHPSFVRVGRQAVTWGEGRLLGSADWSPTGRSLDAARAHWSRGAFDVEVLGAILEATRPLGTEAGDTAGPATGGAQLVGLQGAWAIAPSVHFELSGIARFAPSSDLALDDSRFSVARAAGETYVASLRVFGGGSTWSYGAEGAYETGHVDALGGLKREAFAAAAHVEKTLDTVSLSPSIRGGFAYASGDDGSTRTYRQFDPLLPDVHTWHGAMDLFAWSNLIEENARVAIAPIVDTTFAIEYRHAQMAHASGDWVGAYMQSIGRAPSGASSDLGHEIDGVFTWWPHVALELALGYSALILGKGARAVLEAQDRGAADAAGNITPPKLSHLAYLQATLRVP